MTDKEILTALEKLVEFWRGELEKPARPETKQFRKGVIYGLLLAIEKININTEE